ncbi:MAG: hypothetical protein AAF533_02425 [Acidobacteriota bacterium]
MDAAFVEALKLESPLLSPPVRSLAVGAASDGSPVATERALLRHLAAFAVLIVAGLLAWQLEPTGSIGRTIGAVVSSSVGIVLAIRLRPSRIRLSLDRDELVLRQWWFFVLPGERRRYSLRGRNLSAGTYVFEDTDLVEVDVDPDGLEGIDRFALLLFPFAKFFLLLQRRDTEVFESKIDRRVVALLLHDEASGRAAPLVRLWHEDAARPFIEQAQGR